MANATRRDAREFMDIAAEVGVKTQVQPFPLQAANDVLQRLKHSRINGSAVLVSCARSDPRHPVRFRHSKRPMCVNHVHFCYNG